MTKKRSGITALELHKQLEQDEDYKERIRKKNEELKVIWEMRAKAEEPLIKDILKTGIKISSVYDFVNTADSYPEAIPILVNYIKEQKISEPIIKEGVIRALTVKEAKGIANTALLEEYNKIPKGEDFHDHQQRWLIGNVINKIINENDVDAVLRIVSDKTNGHSRQMFIRALGKIKRSEKVENVLIELLSDEEAILDSLFALSKLKSGKAVSKIKNLLNSENLKIRNEAKKFLKIVK